ncbi:DNA primase family protein [Brachybacterium subflavum]|uniref:DNA primase family protein n=1 Tax=Brachybacterium subflavum TaxID=2585206 RepID=UPI0012660F07|nr:phage/plasmid primase, P4 family [Brachybacterium subflavum]
MAYDNAESKYEQPVWDDDFDGLDISAPIALATPPTEEIPLPDWAVTARRQVLNWLQPRIKIATQSDIIQEATKAILAQLPKGVVPDADFAGVVVTVTNELLMERNGAMPKGTPAAARMLLLRAPTFWQIAQFVIHFHHATLITPNKKVELRDRELLAVYRTDGPRAGTFDSDDLYIRGLANEFNRNLLRKETTEVLQMMREAAPRREKNDNRDLIAFSNGLFYYGTEPKDIELNGTTYHFEPKSFRDFTPDVVFTSKFTVRYMDVPELPEVRILDHVDTDGPDGWEVREWIEDLGDYPGGEGLSKLLWEIISAALRPYVRWTKIAFLYSEVGNNGKGSLCHLIRNILGPGVHASIPLKDFGKEFYLERLLRANAVIVDENPVNTYVDDISNVKAVTNGDTFTVNIKGQNPVDIAFNGLMIQCLNGEPKVKDKSNSWYRRDLFVPFDKTFEGNDLKYIKDDYLQRPEVLEYVAWYAMNRAGAETPGEFYELSNPEVSRVFLEQYKEANDPVRLFWSENRDLFRWDFLPCKSFLYQFYKEWVLDINPEGRKVSFPMFRKSILEAVKNDEDWYADEVYNEEKRRMEFKVQRPRGMVKGAEPLIEQYRVPVLWDPNKGHLAAHWRKNDPVGGIKRKVPGSAKPLPGNEPCEDDCTCHTTATWSSTSTEFKWVNATQDSPWDNAADHDPSATA